MHRSFVVLLSTVLVTGCSYLPWFGGEEDPRPPAELTNLTPAITVQTLWTQRVGHGSSGRRLELVPAVQGNKIFAASADGTAAAVSTADGRVLWQRETKLPFSGGPGAEGTRVLIGSSDGSLVALSAADGTELWRARVDSEILSVPRPAGDIVVLHALDDTIYGFDALKGEQRWKYTYTPPVLTLRGSSSPAIAGKNAIVGLSGGKLVSLELATGLTTWEVTVTPPHGRSDLERIADIDADPVVVGGNVYVGTYNGDLAAVDLQSGAVLWRRALSTSAGLAAADGMLYVTDANDTVWAARPSDGAGVWKQTALKYRRLSPPAVIGDLVAVGDLAGYVHWLSRHDGRILARTKIAGGPITARPVAVGRTLYVLDDDGTLAALSPGAAPPPRPPGPETRVDKQPASVPSAESSSGED
jgi:outer membrane protein assembly factor BamB